MTVMIMKCFSAHYNKTAKKKMRCKRDSAKKTSYNENPINVIIMVLVKVAVVEQVQTASGEYHVEQVMIALLI